MSRTGDVVVVGAGVIGLSIAFELAERGAAVRVVDRGEPAGAASWAAAGMLAPYTERVRDGALVRLCAASLQEYPAFAARVAEASGIDAHLRLDGVVHAAFDAAQLDALRAHAHALAASGVASEVLDRGTLLAREPWLGASAVGGLQIAGEGCVDNRRLGRALVAACATRGVRVERSSIVRVECDERRVLGVHTQLGFVAAGSVVNACGAWAGELAGVPQRCVPPIAPIKGQMIALAAPIDFVRRSTWIPGAYLVPRDDGRLLDRRDGRVGGFRRARHGKRRARAAARGARGSPVARRLRDNRKLGRAAAWDAGRAAVLGPDADSTVCCSRRATIATASCWLRQPRA